MFLLFSSGSGTGIFRESDIIQDREPTVAHWGGDGFIQEEHKTRPQGAGRGDRQPTKPPPQGGAVDETALPLLPSTPGLKRKTRNTFRNGWPRPADRKKRAGQPSHDVVIAWSSRTVEDNTQKAQVGAAEFPKLMQHLRTKKETTEFQ